jgi:hypothetical protein
VKTKIIKPAKSSFSIFRQLCNCIPGHLVAKLGRATKVDQKSRTFSVWSHVVAMLYAQCTHALSLNDICDGLEFNRVELAGIRGAVPPSRNGLSHANRERDAQFAEQLYWAVVSFLEESQPGFAQFHPRRNYAYRFKRPIHLVDATVIQLVANCMDWAKHRARKAAAKCHMRLDLQTYLPRFALIDTAAQHENTRARELCASLKAGEIAVFDKGFMDLEHLHDLTQRGVFWVIRAKDNLAVEKAGPSQPSSGNVTEDNAVRFKHYVAQRSYPMELRLVTARVQVDGQSRELSFLTNNFRWSGQSVADLYRCRWNIEVFFKTLKQTFQVADFLGYSANAVRWQVWISLLSFVLLRFIAWKSRWSAAFVRLFTIIRAALWKRWDLFDLLSFYGTAREPFRMRGQPEQAYFAGFY